MRPSRGHPFSCLISTPNSKLKTGPHKRNSCHQCHHSIFLFVSVVADFWNRHHACPRHHTLIIFWLTCVDCPIQRRGRRQKYHIESEETETKRDRRIEDSEKEGKRVPQTQQHLYREFNHWQEINLQVSDRPWAPLMWPVFPSLGSSRVQTYGSWFEWRLHLLVLQFLPVHVAEEAVLPDVSLPLRTAAQSFRWMLRHQLDGQTEERQLLYVSHSFSPISLLFPVSCLCP